MSEVDIGKSVEDVGYSRMESNKISLHHLPVEIVERIIADVLYASFVGGSAELLAKDLNTCSHVCHQWQQIVTDQVFRQRFDVRLKEFVRRQQRRYRCHRTDLDESLPVATLMCEKGFQSSSSDIVLSDGDIIFLTWRGDWCLSKDGQRYVPDGNYTMQLFNIGAENVDSLIGSDGREAEPVKTGNFKTFKLRAQKSFPIEGMSGSSHLHCAAACRTNNSMYIISGKRKRRFFRRNSLSDGKLIAKLEFGDEGTYSGNDGLMRINENTCNFLFAALNDRLVGEYNQSGEIIRTFELNSKVRELGTLVWPLTTPCLGDKDALSFGFVSTGTQPNERWGFVDEFTTIRLCRFRSVCSDAAAAAAAASFNEIQEVVHLDEIYDKSNVKFQFVDADAFGNVVAVEYRRKSSSASFDGEGIVNVVGFGDIDPDYRETRVVLFGPDLKFCHVIGTFVLEYPLESWRLIFKVDWTRGLMYMSSEWMNGKMYCVDLWKNGCR